MKRVLLVSLAVLVALAALGYGAYAWHHAITYVSTDDAYVEGAVSPVSAKVPGHIVELHVTDHQPVKKGDLLFRVDPRDWQAKRDQAQAAVAMAAAATRAARADVTLTRATTQALVEQSRAALDTALVTVRAAESAVEESRARLEARRASVDALRAELVGGESTRQMAHRELERMSQLLKGGLIAQRDFDQAKSTFDTTDATLGASRKRLTAAQQEAQQAEAEIASRQLGVEQARQRVTEARTAVARAESQLHEIEMKESEARRAEARLKEAEADLAYATLQLQHTEVRAALDGMIAKRTVELGQIVQTGQPLMAIVPLHDVWVVANFKETQLGKVRPGMQAKVTVDTFPGQTFTGVVESISAGTGARFSLLPPENATGNWVKVVQRVPVRIRLENHEPSNPHTLRAGMSSVVTIRVRE